MLFLHECDDKNDQDACLLYQFDDFSHALQGAQILVPVSNMLQAHLYQYFPCCIRKV